MKLIAREILDSRGNPTVEVDCITDFGVARASVPSGASTGVHEALEMRDGGERYMGKGVLRAVNNVNKILARELEGMDVVDQKSIDRAMIELDNTDNKSKLGANAILGVSMAVCKAGALAKNVPLYKHISDISRSAVMMPVPAMNVINGGRHAGNALDIQEFMIMPVGAGSFSDALRMGSEVYHALKAAIKEKYGPSSINVGDEGGFAPPLNNSKDPLKIISDAVKTCGYEGQVKLAIDAAASEFFKKGKYHIDGRQLSGEELGSFYGSLLDDHEIFSIEDPFDQEDFASYAGLTLAYGNSHQIVGDDLLVTNVKRINTAIEKKACNALLLKLNQIGTVTEAIDAAALARDNGWKVMVSHRSGETEDSFIADLVCGLGTGQIKSGAPCRGERLAKYNQLLRIEQDCMANYAGKKL